MIRLQRPLRPQKLRRAAHAATEKLWAAWRAGGPLIANRTIYADPGVKTALRTAQHDKCAFCETTNPSAHGVVEHYRPKDGWRQKRRDPLQKPEYFWLAYDWENLLFACDVCNDRSHKENLFPLADPAKRATAALPDIAVETPLLVNPYGPLDPEEHINWDSDVPKPRNGSPYGKETIGVLGLDRDGRRADFRRAHLQGLEKQLQRVENLKPDNPDRPGLVTDFRRVLNDEAPWAAMIRANFGVRIRAL